MEENKNDITQEITEQSDAITQQVAEQADTTPGGDWSEALKNDSDAEQLDQAIQAKPMSEENYEDDQDEKQSLIKKVKASFWWTIIRTVIALVIIAIGVYLILYLVARAAKYETISAMLQSMFIELELMWQRVLY